MNRFAPILREVHAKLDLPQPGRSRIVLEMAADLEDLFDAYVARGIEPDEAARRVEERFAVTDDVIAELVRIHETPARPFLRGLSERARSRGERIAFTGLLVFLIVFAGRQALSAGFFADASAFVWPVLGLTSVAAALAAAKAYELWVRGDHDPRRLRSGLGSILALGGAALVVGFFGLAAEAFFAAGRAVRDGPNALRHLIEFMLRVSPMVMTSLLAALVTAILWYLLTEKVERIEVAKAAVLLGE